MNNTPVFKKSPLAAALATIISVCALPLTATADTRTWYGQYTSGGWDDVSTEEFYNSFGQKYYLHRSNWINLAVNPNGSLISSIIPQSGDSLIFQGSQGLNSYNDLIDLSIAGITFSEGAGSFNLSGNAVTSTGNIFNNSSSYQTIAMPIYVGADQIWDGGSAGLAINNMSMGNYDLTLQNNLKVNSGDISLAYNGTASLTIKSGSSFSSYRATLGSFLGSVGTAIVNANSTWYSGSLFIGVGGKGVLDIVNGGYVHSDINSIGVNSGSNGTVSVWNTGSVFDNVELMVGVSGMGKLDIQAGGKVLSDYASLGYGSGGTGTAIVKGTGSQWINNASLVIGGLGTGTISIEDGGSMIVGRQLHIGSEGVVNLNGGSLSAYSADMAAGGQFTWTAGTLNLTNASIGTGSLFGDKLILDPDKILNVSDDLVVNGSSPDMPAILTIRGGGKVTSGNSHLVNGTATVTGSNSLWKNSGVFSVELGTLNINDGGQVTSTNGYVGGLDVGGGTVNVSGIGSVWENSSDLSIGGAAGDLNIKDGGQVSNIDGYLGAQGEFGTVKVTGANSKWINTGRLIIGDELTIENGGQVSNTDGSLEGTGIVTITGINATTRVRSLWTSSGDLSVSGMLFVENGGEVRDTNGFLGFTNMGEAEVTVKGVGSWWENSEGLSIGETGTGKLYIQNGGRVSNVNDGIIGVVSNSVGEVWVTDRGSVWSNDSYLVIGDSGNGKLTTENAGKVFSSGGYLGVVAGAGKGTATVTGEESLWANVGDLTVGYGSEGALNIESGGKVSNTIGIVGDQSGSVGIAHVRGAGVVTGVKSRWENSENLSVGYFGNGTLNIENGGQVVNAVGYLAVYKGSTGSATVTGTNSLWTNNDELFVGHTGIGTLNIEKGGRVNNTDSYLGNFSTGVGNTIVTGVNSLWANSGHLIVGWEGSGVLDINSGARVSNTNGVIASNTNSTGAVKVNGANSLWTNTGDLSVGESGAGTLNINEGGQVRNVNGYLGHNTDDGSNGTATVTGPNSRWDNSGNLYVGFSGKGTLNIQNGGKVSNTYGTVGYNPNYLISGSEATVSGVDLETGMSSVWENSAGLTIGDTGVGLLNIENGGQVISSYGELGHDRDGIGTTIVMGISSWTNQHSLSVGVQGIGTLKVDEGGQVVNTTGFIGRGNSSTGTATVSGVDWLTGLNSDWANSGDLTIGYDGNGTLNVQNGGHVSNVNGYLGFNSTGIGSVMVKGVDAAFGANALWENTGNLIVGGEGIGALDIEDGGIVSVGGTLNIGQWGAVNLNGGSLTATAAVISNGGHFYWTAGSLNIAGDNDFTLGENSSFAGFSSLGNGQTFAVNKNLYVNGKPLELSGGQAKAASLVLNGSGEVVGYGAVAADITGGTSANTIAAKGGSLRLGNVNSTTGFDYGGNLDVGSEQVTLLDKDQANLGVSTSISDGGKLITVNGADLGNGEMLNFVGNADVVGNFTNNGVVSGSEGSLAFTNDVKGAGSFGGDIHFLAAYNPGNSPAAIDFNGGDASFASTSILTLEIFGNMPGSQYDQLLNINHLNFNGSLVLAFGNGFTPFAGESFDFFDFVSFTGSFDPNRISVTGIDRNLLDFSSLAINGKLQVTAVPLPAGVWLFMTGLTALLAGSRKKASNGSRSLL